MKKSKNHIICKVCEQKSALKIDPYDITTILYKAESSNPRFHNYESAYCENCGVIFMIDFPDQKIRVMAQVEADDLEKDLKLGIEVETIVGVVRKAKDGSDIYSYKFRPVK